MRAPNARFVRWVLFTNGAIDLFAAIALFFPTLGLPLPGYAVPHAPALAFVAGGWAIAALCLGVGRIWVSCKPEFYWVMTVLGVLEGTVLSAFCLVNVFFLGMTWAQVMLALVVSGPYGILYLAALRRYDAPRLM